jgi:hypothetical protein
MIDYGFDPTLLLQHDNGLHFAKVTSSVPATSIPADSGFDPSLLNKAKAKVPFFAKAKGAAAAAAASVHGDEGAAAPSTKATKAKTSKPRQTLLPQGGLGQGVRTRNVPWRLETA